MKVDLSCLSRSEGRMQERTAMIFALQAEAATDLALARWVAVTIVLHTRLQGLPP